MADICRLLAGYSKFEAGPSEGRRKEKSKVNKRLVKVEGEPSRR